VLTVDANKDTSGARNITITGELDAATLDISGDADIDGTTNLDAVDIDGDVDLAGDLTFSAAKDIQIIDNNAAALEIAEAGNNYVVFHSTDGSEKVEVAKTLDVTGGLKIGGTAVTSDAGDLNLVDGITAGTVAASKAVVVDSDKDISGFRNITLTGELDAATLDISGDADIDGTANLDAVDIDGATQIDGTVTVGVDDTGFDVKFFGATSGSYLLWDEDVDDLILGGAARVVVPDGQLVLGSTAVSSTAAEINTLDGVTAGTISASKAVVVDANSDISGFRNITLTGELDAATLDISGDADIDGTLNADAVDIDGDVDLAGDLTFSAAKDIQLVDNNAAALEIAEAGNNYLTFDTSDSAERVHAKKDLVQNPASSIAPASNGELVVEATNNTTLTFKLKGSDGTVRTGTLTLS
jgi:cytoskeletal protein CcmA (bactofilin family)